MAGKRRVKTTAQNPVTVTLTQSPEHMHDVEACRDENIFTASGKPLSVGGRGILRTIFIFKKYA